VQFQGFLQILEGFFYSLVPAGNVNLEALGDVPFPFAPYGRSKWSLDDEIVSEGDRAIPSISLTKRKEHRLKACATWARIVCFAGRRGSRPVPSLDIQWAKYDFRTR